MELMPNYGRNIKLINIIIDNKCYEKIKEDDKIKIDWRSLGDIWAKTEWWRRTNFLPKNIQLGIENVAISDRLF